jgi:hypothetical protein
MTQARIPVASFRKKMKLQNWSHPKTAAKRADRSVRVLNSCGDVCSGSLLTHKLGSTSFKYIFPPQHLKTLVPRVLACIHTDRSRGVCVYYERLGCDWDNMFHSVNCEMCLVYKFLHVNIIYYIIRLNIIVTADTYWYKTSHAMEVQDTEENRA